MQRNSLLSLQSKRSNLSSLCTSQRFRRCRPYEHHEAVSLCLFWYSLPKYCILRLLEKKTNGKGNNKWLKPLRKILTQIYSPQFKSRAILLCLTEAERYFQ